MAKPMATATSSAMALENALRDGRLGSRPIVLGVSSIHWRVGVMRRNCVRYWYEKVSKKVINFEIFTVFR